MSTRTSTLAPDNNTDANFRLWINEIHNSLIAFGWIRTSDTGQIDYATVTRPTAINTYQGYAVYRMDDSLQSTCAVFMRLDYGTGGTTDTPGLKIQVTIGGTDGAGTLTGNTSTQMVSTGGTAGTTSLRNCRASGTTSMFRMAFWTQSANGYGVTFAVERDFDTSGAETSLGINIAWVWAGNAAITKGSQFLELAGGTGALESLWLGLISSQTSQSGSGVVGVAAVRTALGPLRNPMKGMLIYSRTDFTMETTNPVTIYGASHTYLMLRPHPTSALSLNTINADCGMALLWE